MADGHYDSGCFAAGFADLDRDGWLDLVTVNDKGEEYAPDRFFHGSEDGFTEDAEGRGLAQRHSGMGIGIADFDGDGWLDVWKTSAPTDRLLSSVGDGQFVDRSVAAGLGAGADRLGSTWDMEVLDIDHDGDFDALVLAAQYAGDEGEEPVPDKHQVFVNDGHGDFTFVDATLFGIPPGSQNRSLSLADFDGDGAADLALPGEEPSLRLLHGRCGDGGFLRISVEGTHCSREAPGTVVQITDTAGRTQESTVLVGGQVQSSGSSDIHFGLDGASGAESVRVTFPCGRQVEILDLPASVFVHVTEPAEPG